MTTEPESLRASLPKSDEPVAWQYRFRGENWADWSEWHDAFSPEGAKEREATCKSNDYEVETRALYTSPSPDSRNDVIGKMRDAINYALRSLRLEQQFSSDARKYDYLIRTLEMALKNSPPPPPGWVNADESDKELELHITNENARRYLWLKDPSDGTLWSEIINDYLPEKWDEAIDKAMLGSLPIPPKAQ
jgi:hypothetical protein